MPASPRQASSAAAYSITLARATWCASDGSSDSGSRTPTVSAFGEVAPSSMPSSSPAPDSATATLGLDSLLQASLRISELMNRSTGPGGCPSIGRGVRGRPSLPDRSRLVSRVRGHLCHLGATSMGGA